MQYPGTVDKWFDHSGITIQPIVDTATRPLMLAAAAFDRGPEKITRVYGEDFFKLYGYYIDFEKYGQAALQCANIISSGGELMLKRVVAKDSTLANIVVVANVTADRVHKTDSVGNPLYIDPVTQQETTDEGDGNQAVIINVARIRHEILTVQGAKNIEEVYEEARRSFVEDDETNTFSYPLFVITDNGRGESTKRFGIDPQYTLSKNNNFMIYRLKYLGSEDLDAEQVYFVLKPGVMYLGESMDLEMTSSKMLQGEGKPVEDAIEAFYDKVSEISGIEVTELYKYDLLFGKSNKGVAVRGISIDDKSQDLGILMGGFPLMSGSNGSFGDRPIDTAEYETELVEFFNGTYDEDIFNLDMYKPDACVDANYPLEVKQAICELADFRKDFCFFGDLGLEISTYENAVNKYYEMPKGNFYAWYGQSYQVLNPFNQRRIYVTMNYNIANRIIEHLNTRRNAPYCGIMYGWTFPEAIEGTINFTPKITPKVNQKQALDDLRLNYASILNNTLTLETTYSSQENLTQLSFINNVIAIQAIIKDVRNQCPAFRYSFVTAEDLAEYKSQVGTIINRYSSWFESLEVVYVQDDIMKANKIFEVSMMVKHKDFVQSEILNIYVLGTEQATIASADTSIGNYETV